MSYLLVAGVVVAVLLWGPFMRRLLRREQWRIGSGALSIGVLAAAGFVAARGGWPEGLLLAVIALMFAISSRWPRARPAPPPENGMSLEQARAMLGVGPEASRADIQAAYNRLMKRVHPDHGGASGLATQLNLARDRLLKT
jgi:hypothetical protein